MDANEYLLTIRLTTKKSLDPEAVRNIEGKVAELVHNTIWEASGVVDLTAKLWGHHAEGRLGRGEGRLKVKPEAHLGLTPGTAMGKA
jgi:hypothetical protein